MAVLASTAVAPDPAVGEQLERLLDRFLADRRNELAIVDHRLGRAVTELHSLMQAGGKRIRPWFVSWGYRAARGEPDERLAYAAAAVELVHTFALIQDDMIDRSPLRRGRETVHLTLAREAGAAYGHAAAMLLSDLVLVWADRLLVESGYKGERLRDAFAVFNLLREEVTIGQFQDLALTAFGPIDEDGALQVILRKTVGYTVRRPLELGMSFAGGDERLREAAAGYAEPAGAAFQLRDDLLGAFGDRELTGKSEADDLADVKPTWLLARGLSALGPAADQLRRLVALPRRGPGEVQLMREALLATGAVQDAERLIGRLHDQALRATNDFDVPCELRGELEAMTDALVNRQR